MQDDTVPLKYVRTFLRVIEAQGYDVHEAATSCGLSTELLSPLSNPDTAVSAGTYSRLYTHTMDLLHDESFGFRLKQRVPSGSFRIMCLFLIHSANLHEALLRAAEFHVFCCKLSGVSYAQPNPITYIDADTAMFRFPGSSELFGSENATLYNVAYCLAIWRRFCSWLIGRQVPLLEVQFENSDPGERSYLTRIFDCPCAFSQPSNAFTFSASFLDAPLVHTEESLKKFLRSAPYQLLATSGLDSDEEGIVGQMRHIIGHDLSREFPTVVDMSFELNMSVRTLRRRLKDVGTTYQQFKDRTRCDAAMELLNRPELKVNAVAALLGFDEPSAFHRSFKKWTGRTPGEYRQANNAP